MGVLNLTPDSFYDGANLGAARVGKFRIDVDKALRRADGMLAEGARLIDVGGESTRPGAREVPLQEELDRVLPVVEALLARLDAIVSVDTSSPEVMQAVAAAGAGMINDVRALRRPGAVEAAAGTDMAVCLMHMRGEPGTMQEEPEYEDVVAEVAEFLRRRADTAIKAGINPQCIVIDPGFGFGKNTQHNFTLLRELRQFTEFGYPVLAGLSRKSMIGAATGRVPEQRLPGSIAAVMLALHGGARIIRSHDVAATVDAIGVHSMLQQDR
ncbi:MAG: dihydropteroate synthase [Gammaproteobacteria bacterium]|nr:dihydropteroate synthase [Gammaproteobacteria bacterium]MYE30569.1 dihydropteroate synthase [Gammaproteobacteria bacterium]